MAERGHEIFTIMKQLYCKGDDMYTYTCPNMEYTLSKVSSVAINCPGHNDVSILAHST